MTTRAARSLSAQSELLLLPNGSVLTRNLTPELASVLSDLGFRIDTDTHCPLAGRGGGELEPHGLDDDTRGHHELC